MAKKLSFIITLAPYPFDVFISFGLSDKELVYKMNHSYKLDITGSCDCWGYEAGMGKGRTCILPTGQIILRMDDIPSSMYDYSVLHHEIFHVVELLFHRIGIKHRISSGEAWAYMIGFITLEVYKKINNGL